jgi:redox-sensing transcriptional repressor
MAQGKIPDIVVGRLPLYLRALEIMVDDNREITSSQELGDRLGISSAQIRKDLSQFGEFGKQGTGYNVTFLVKKLKEILHVNKTWPMVLVGVGDLGRAVADYGGFTPRGFKVEAVYDSDPQKIGKKVGSFTIRDASQLEGDLRKNGIKIVMLAVPTSAAQEIADRVIKVGVNAILCYSSTSISAPSKVHVEYIDPVLHLQRMTYYMR